MIKKLQRYVGEYRKAAFLAPLLIVGEVIMEILIPFVMAAVIDKGLQGKGGMHYTMGMGALMVVMSLLSLGFGAAAGKYAAVAGVGFARNLRNALFVKVQNFTFANVDRFSAGSLVTRLTTDVTNTQNALMMTLRLAVRAPLMLIGSTVMAVLVNSKLAAVFLAVIPVMGALLFMILYKAHPRFEKMLEQYDQLNTIVQENLIGIRVVKAFVREEHEKQKFQVRADGVRWAQLAAEKLVILNMPVMQICMYGCIVAVLWFGGNMITAGTMAVGELASFISYIGQVLMSLMMISLVFIMVVLSHASLNRITEVLDEVVDIQDPEPVAANELRDGSIEFHNVSFSYAGDRNNLTLQQVNLKIAAGETIGIIGGVGSAKTTLVQLIPRLYDVFEGELDVGGHNVKDYPLQKLRDGVAMVLQKNVLFSGTIRTNLKWGKEDAAEVELVEACKAAQAYDFIMALPEGFDTHLGQGGLNLSGGQKQRLCIARALLKKPKILILDDSTSAVDTATDARIRKAFKTQLAGITKIIIAQRVASICEADRIIVLEEGRINGYGTHQQLLRHNQIYREIYESQQKGAEEHGAGSDGGSQRRCQAEACREGIAAGA